MQPPRAATANSNAQHHRAALPGTEASSILLLKGVVNTESFLLASFIKISCVRFENHSRRTQGCPGEANRCGSKHSWRAPRGQRDTHHRKARTACIKIDLDGGSLHRHSRPMDSHVTRLMAGLLACGSAPWPAFPEQQASQWLESAPAHRLQLREKPRNCAALYAPDSLLLPFVTTHEKPIPAPRTCHHATLCNT